jgi:hypothetical protein
MTSPLPPTLVVVNARIGTNDPTRPWATALSIQKNSLAAIASTAEIIKTANSATHIVDAGGRSIALPAGMSVGSSVRVVAIAGGDVTISLVEDLV